MTPTTLGISLELRIYNFTSTNSMIYTATSLCSKKDRKSHSQILETLSKKLVLFSVSCIKSSFMPFKLHTKTGRWSSSLQHIRHLVNRTWYATYHTSLLLYHVRGNKQLGRGGNQDLFVVLSFKMQYRLDSRPESKEKCKIKSYLTCEEQSGISLEMRVCSLITDERQARFIRH